MIHALLEGVGIGIGASLGAWCLSSARDFIEGMFSK